MTEDQLYAATTQCQTWSFGPATLSTIRENTNAAGIRTIRRGWKRARLEATSTANTPAATTPIPSSTPTPTPTPIFSNASIDPSAVPDPEPLTAAEELTLLHYYILKLIDMSDVVFSFPSNVKSTACVFLSRFYLHHSIQSYHPKHILTTILFLATKSENHYIPLSEFCKRIPKLKPETVLKHEFAVAGGVGWDLDVRNPLRAAEGGVMELLTALSPLNTAASQDPGLQALKDKLAPNPTRRVQEAHGRMKNYLTREALLSDAYYHYTPPQIFLGALWAADNDLGEAYIEWRFGEGATMGRVAKKRKKEGKKSKKGEIQEESVKEEVKSEGPALSLKLLPVVRKCGEMMQNAKDYGKTAPEELKRIDKKLYNCQNPQKFLGAGSAIGNGNNGGSKKNKPTGGEPPAPQPEGTEKKRKLEDDGFGEALPGKD